MHEHVLLPRVRDEAADILRRERLFIEPGGERALRREDGGGPAGVLRRAGLCCGFEHADEGELRHGLQAGEKIMRGVAGHDDAAGAAGLQRAQGRGHFRHGIFAAGQDGRRAVRDAGVGVDVDADVIVVAGSVGQKRDLAEQVRRGERPHAAQNADGFFHCHTPFD